MSKTEIIGMERRRKYSDAEKASLLAEAMETSISAVSRKYGISRPIIQNWKKQTQSKAFALVEVNDQPGTQESLPEPSRKSNKQPDPLCVPSNMIRVVVQNRIVVEFPMSVEPSAIALFIKALEN